MSTHHALNYLQTSFPRWLLLVSGAHIFYEQKANLTLQQSKSLRDAGSGHSGRNRSTLVSAPPTHAKGVSAAQNIRLLRYCKSCSVAVHWNILYAFPHDRLAWYEDTLRLLPLLRHLDPPSGLNHLIIERFSPYHTNPGAVGLSALGPIDAYRSVLPQTATYPKLHTTSPELMRANRGENHES